MALPVLTRMSICGIKVGVIEKFGHSAVVEDGQSLRTQVSEVKKNLLKETCFLVLICTIKPQNLTIFS